MKTPGTIRSAGSIMALALLASTHPLPAQQPTDGARPAFPSDGRPGQAAPRVWQSGLEAMQRKAPGGTIQTAELNLARNQDR